MVDASLLPACGSLITGPCVTNFTIFWSVLVSAMMLPLALFIFLYIIPGPSIVTAFIRSRLSGAPMILKVRRDKRTEMIVGEYKSGVIFNGKKEGFIPQLDSFYYLPSGHRFALANEQFGSTLPHQLVKDIQYYKEKGFRNIEEVEQALVQKEAELLALKGGDESKMTDEERAKLKEIRESKDYVSYLTQAEKSHSEMFVPFARIQNFFKNNINPSYIRSAIEEAVSEQLASQRKVDVNKLLSVLMIGGFVTVLLLAILSSIDLSNLGNIGSGAGAVISDGGRIVQSGAGTAIG